MEDTPSTTATSISQHDANQQEVTASQVATSQTSQIHDKEKKPVNLILEEAQKSLADLKNYSIQKYCIVGDYLDVMDSRNQWCIGRILSIDEKGAMDIRFDGWSDKYKETIFKYSRKIDSFHRWTEPYTGSVKVTVREDFTMDSHRQKATEKIEEMSALEDGFKVENIHEFLQYFRGELFFYGDTILSCPKPFPEKDIQLYVEFFLAYIRLFVKYVKVLPSVLPIYIEAMGINKSLFLVNTKVALASGFMESFTLIHNIFAGESIRCTKFYRMNKFEFIQQDDPYAIKSKDGNNDGNYEQMLNFINYFGTLYGFDNLLDLVSWEYRASADTPLYLTPISIIKKIVDIFDRCLLYMPKKKSISFCTNLKQRVFDRISKITNREFKDVYIEEVLFIIKCMSEIHQRVTGESEACEEAEKLEVRFIVRLIKCQFLEKKISGIFQLKSIINRANLATPSKQQFFMSNNSSAFQFLTRKKLRTCLEEENLLDYLLSENFNPEIFKRSFELFNFLSEESALSLNHLDAIWKLTENKHETDLAAIHSVIIELAKILQEKSLDQMFRNINTLPFERYSHLIINLLKEFTLNAAASLNPASYFPKSSKQECYKSKEFEHYGLPKLWNAIQDTNKLPNQLTNPCVEALCEILSSQHFRSQREKYIALCFENLKNGQSVPQSLQLSIFLLKTFSQSSGFMGVVETTAEGIILKYNKEVSLIDYIVQDFENYQTLLFLKLKRNGVVLDEKQGEEIFAGKYGHIQNIDIRFEFISLVNKYMQSKGKDITVEQLKKLWKILVRDNVTSLEKTRFLAWIIKRKQSTQQYQQGSSVLDEGMLAQSLNVIFEDKDLMNGYQIDQGIFECFRSIFSIVNLKNKSIEVNGQSLILVAKFDSVVGRDILWLFSQNCQDALVLQQIRNLLVSIYLRKTTKSSESRYKMWMRFQDKCQEVLSQTQSPLVQAHIVLTLKAFLQEMEGKMAFGDKKQEIQIQITCPALGQLKKTLKLPYNASLLKLRKEISKEFKLGNKDFDMLYLNKNITISKSQEEEFSVEALQTNDNKFPTIQVIQLRDNNLDAQEVSQFRQQLANSAFSEILIDLLSNGKNDEIVDNALDVLNILPKNTNIVKKLKSIDSQDNQALLWEDLLPSKCYRKLQYCLQIISEQFIGQSETQDQWCRSLIKRGGLKHLLDVFFIFGNDSSFEKTFHLFYISTLTQIISALMGTYYAVFPGEFKTSSIQNDFLEALAQKTISNISQALTACREKLVKHKIPQDNILLFFQYCFELLISVLSQEQDLVASHLHSESSTLSSIVEGLLLLQDERVRQQLSDSLIKVIDLDPSHEAHLVFQKSLATILKNEQDKMNSAYRSTCYEFFTLYTAILKHLQENKSLLGSKSISYADLAATLETVVLMIKNSTTFEKTRYEVDGMLRGAFECAQQLISMDVSLAKIVIQDQDLIKFVVEECLFSFNSEEKSDAPKCKSSKSRQSAFAFLAAVQAGIVNQQTLNSDAYRDIQDVNELINNFFSTAHWRTKSKADWNIREEQEKEDNCPIGLRNLGCTCYMNSIIQQLFMIRDFSDNLLKINASASEANFNPKENVLYQLQEIFGALGLSQRQSYDPRDFCNAFKDFDGQPTNVLQQMDVDEFFTTLMDRVEALLKPSQNEFIIKDIFEGQLSNELIGKGGGCTHRSEREEPFLVVNLPAKNKKNLHECLQSFVQGEMLDGDNSFFCEKCDKKVPTLKRQSIKKLPNQLLIVLKRFHFDLDMMQKIKINSYCEFPEKIDLRQYTAGYLKEKDSQAERELLLAGKENTPEIARDTNNEKPADDTMPAEYFGYKLRGVVIHQGTSESGHYYSFIRQSEDKWLEFNDTLVQPFNFADLPAEAFGGDQDNSTNNNPQAWGSNLSSSKQANNKNAYILVYERETFFDNEGKIMKSLIDQTRIHNPINTVKENILRENKKLHLNKYLFSSDIQEYTNQLLDTINVFKQTNYSRKLSEFLLKYYSFCLSRQNDKAMIPAFRKKLGDILAQDYELSSWFLRNAANESFIREMFLDCFVDDVKYLISGLFIEAIKTVCAQEATISYDTFVESSSLLPLLNIGIYLVVSPPAGEVKQLDLFYRILCAAGEFSVNGRRYLLKQKMVGRIQSMLIEIRSSGGGYQDYMSYRTLVGASEFELENQAAKEETTNISQKIQSIDELLEQKEKNRRIIAIKKNFQYLVKLHSILVRSVQPYPAISIPETATFAVQPRIQHELNKDELETFKLSGYFKRVLPLCFKKTTRNYLTLTQAYLTTENEPLMNEFMNNWNAIISDPKFDQDDLKPYFIFLKNILLIEDSLKLKRVKIVASKCSAFMQSNFRYFYAGQLVINAIIKFGGISKAFAGEIQKEINTNKDFLNSLENFLKGQNNISYSLNNRQMSLFRDENKLQQLNNQYIQSATSLIKRSASSRRDKISAIQSDGQLPALEYDSDEDYSEHVAQVNEKLDLLVDGEYQTHIVTETLGDLIQLQKCDDKNSSRWIKFDDEALFTQNKAARYYLYAFDELHY